LQIISFAYIVPTMPANPLTSEQLSDATRLKNLFKQWQQRRKDEGLPGSQEAASEMLGFNQSAMSQYLNGRIPLNIDAATKFATLIGCPVSEFSPALATQVARYVEASAAVAPAVGEGSIPYLSRASRVVIGGEDDEVFPIKMVNLHLQAGFPGFEVDQQFDDGGTVNIPRRVIERNDWVAQCLLAIKVKGESMKPVLSPGDTVVINIADTRPVSGEIYAINYDGTAVIKQLVYEAGAWWMYSFNRLPEFGRRIFRSPESIIVGKVVYQPGRILQGRL
jgi:phage repressor protein C with HTH and peptisase S24 domain